MAIWEWLLVHVCRSDLHNQEQLSVLIEFPCDHWESKYLKQTLKKEQAIKEMPEGVLPWSFPQSSPF